MQVQVDSLCKLAMVEHNDVVSILANLIHIIINLGSDFLKFNEIKAKRKTVFPPRVICKLSVRYLWTACEFSSHLMENYLKSLVHNEPVLLLGSYL